MIKPILHNDLLNFSGAQIKNTKTQEPACESAEFLAEQLITYMGNKRALLNFIGGGIKIARKRLAKNKLALFDVFSGSGIVARYFKQFSNLLIANDLEKYSTVINQCYLSNKNDVNIEELLYHHREIINETNKNLKKGIVSELYAPGDEQNIEPGDRVFYTVRNAMYIDTVRKFIDKIPSGSQKYFLAPLLSEASIHANTSGVFKGFYKNRETGLGQFGGKNEDALPRIKGDIKLPFPVFSNFDTDVLALNGDANKIINTVPDVDLAYLDPPYNQHPYGSNYFMLNLIIDYTYPENASVVSGIPGGWNRSNYNKENYACTELRNLVENIKAKFVLVSFNSEGFIGLKTMKNMLAKIGKVEVLETKYNVFRGSRNLNKREIHVKEYLYLLEK